ncbi:hypothetical protein NEIRO02_1752 [Nematocida sp. AWRm79]|nr:hypothetical protein NEIRO02_1752 [Nematocida sp. AWRm79]
MENENMHRDWISIFNRLLKKPKSNLKEISRILGRSQKFLSILSTGGASTAYASYADSLRESVERILSTLILYSEDTDSHPGIFFIVCNYKDAYKCDFHPVIKVFLEGTKSVYLLKIIEKVCSNVHMVRLKKEEEIVLLSELVKCSASVDHLIGESAIRSIFGLYKRERGDAVFLAELTKTFQMRYLDLFVSKIFPEIIGNEDTQFVISMIQVLSEIKEIPILIIAHSASRECLLSCPTGLLDRMWARLENEKLPQEYLSGMKMAAKVPELFDINRFLRLLVKYTGMNVLYDQGEVLIQYINTVLISPVSVIIKEKKCTNGSIEQTEKTIGNSEDIPINGVYLNTEIMVEFLEKLYRHSDGTRIEYCRILFYTGLESQKACILLLLKNKNIRVKWNALRTLTAYALDASEIEIVLDILKTTENEKMKLWCLKILECNHRKVDASAFVVKDTQYKSEIEEILKRINN